jgi:hypothetical protein
MRKILSGFCLLFLIVLTQSTTHADPIVITGGSFVVTGAAGGPSYTLTGDNFSVTSTGGDQGNLTPQAVCFPCADGTVFSLSGVFVGQSLGSGSITLNGTTFTNVGFGGTFVFNAPQFTFDPPTAPNDTVIQTAFSFTGLLQVCPTSCLINPPLFTVDLIGGGVVDLELQFAGFNSQGVQIYTFKRITYSFRKEVPEPVSLLLLSSGLAALGLKFRRTRMK